MPDSSLFAPPTVPWQRVSPALRTARMLVLVPPIVVVGALVTVGAQLVFGQTWLTAALAVATVGLALWGLSWSVRNTASWGWAEQDDDLVVTSGVWFRRLVCVPYGRMQYVDVSAGPVAQKMGFATVSLHTAHPGTSATIPGVPADEARRLRDRLTELGEAHGAGL